MQPKFAVPCTPVQQHYSPHRLVRLQTDVLTGGIKAAALDTPGPNVCVAAFVSAGSAAENASNSGVSKLLEYLAFKATANRTTFRLTRELEKYGAAATAFAGREHISYAIEGTKLQSSEITEILLDVMLNQRCVAWFHLFQHLSDYWSGLVWSSLKAALAGQAEDEPWGYMQFTSAVACSATSNVICSSACAHTTVQKLNHYGVPISSAFALLIAPAHSAAMSVAYVLYKLCQRHMVANPYIHVMPCMPAG